MTIVATVTVAAEPALAQDKARYAEEGVVFDHPKDWTFKTSTKSDITNISGGNTKATQVLIQLHLTGIDPKALRDLMDMTFRKQYEGKLVKGSEKVVKRKLAGSEREGVAMSYEVAKGVTTNFELYAFTLPSKKRVMFVLFGHLSLYAEAAKQELNMVADSLAEEAATGAIAEAGFNGKGGIGDSGWAAPAKVALQKKVVFEGDAALHLSNTGLTRRLKAPQKGTFVVEQQVQVPAGGGTMGYIRSGEGPTGDGPVWRVANGKFQALHDGKWLDTPFAAEAGKWHKVVLRIDVPQQRWEFSVDDRKFEKPVGFRSKVALLDTVRYQCENVPGIYIDAVRVLREASVVKRE
jgi:hypothetical protein